MFLLGILLISICAQKSPVNSAPTIITDGNKLNPVLRQEPQFPFNSHNSQHSSNHNIFPFAWDVHYPLDSYDPSKRITNIDNSAQPDHNFRVDKQPRKPKIEYVNNNGNFETANKSPDYSSFHNPLLQWQTFSSAKHPPFNFQSFQYPNYPQNNFHHNVQTMLPFPEFSNNFPTLPPFSQMDKQKIPSLPPYPPFDTQNFPTLPPLSQMDGHKFPTLPPLSQMDGHNFPTLPPLSQMDGQNFPTLPPLYQIDGENFPTLPPLSQMDGQNFPSLPLFPWKVKHNNFPTLAPLPPMDTQNFPPLPPFPSKDKHNNFPMLPPLSPMDTQNSSTLPPFSHQAQHNNFPKLSLLTRIDTQNLQTLPPTQKPSDISEKSVNKKMRYFDSNLADKKEPLQSNLLTHLTQDITYQMAPSIETESPNLLSHMFNSYFLIDAFTNEKDVAVNDSLLGQEHLSDIIVIGVPLNCSQGRCFCPYLHYYDSHSGRCLHQNSVWSV